MKKHYSVYYFAFYKQRTTMKTFILYPNQLFKNLSKLKNKKIAFNRRTTIFYQYDFHIQKLILHRA